MIIGIDASNISSGGGLTHLISLLNEVDNKDGVLIKIWASNLTLSKVKDSFLIEKFSNIYLNKNLFYRFFFQMFLLKKELEKSNCDVLFVPGGTYLGNFKPFITMCRNMLPFEKRESDRYKYSLMYFKLILLQKLQLKTFKKADGIIFLTAYAKSIIQKFIPEKIISEEKYPIISHGVNKKFFLRKKTSITELNKSKLIKCVYTSTIDKYKHQENIINAIANLRKKNFQLQLHLIGHSNDLELKILNNLINKKDPKKQFIFYEGSLSVDQIIKIYENTDLFIYGSTCENLPNILLEKMATKIPILSSNKEPMKEVLKDGGLYFDAESIDSIEKSIIYALKFKEKLINNTKIAHSLVYKLTWKRTAINTLNFLKVFIK